MKIARFVLGLVLLSGFIQPLSAFADVATTVYVDNDSAILVRDGLAPETAFATIAEGVAFVGAGGTVYVADGTYTLSSTLEINKALTLDGETEAGTIIDASGVSSYGIHTNASNITLRDFTLNGNPSGGANYGLKLEGVGGVANTGLSVSHVTVKNAGGSGFDLNGISGSTFTDITATNNLKNGFALTDGNNVTVTNITTSGSSWGGIALYASGTYFPGGVDSFTLSGTNSFSEAAEVYTEIDNIAYDITNLTLSTTEFPYKVTRSSANQVFYSTSESKADVLVGTFGADGVKESRTPVSHTSVYVSTTGNDANDGTEAEPFLTIGAAIAAVDVDGTVHVGAGTFTEQLLIEKSLTLMGNGSASTLIEAPSSLSAGIFGANGITVNTTGIVDIGDLWITGPGPSGCGSIDYGIFVGGGANAFVHGTKITEIRDEPLSGCQNGGGIRFGSDFYGTSATGTIDSNTVTGYQKGGIVVDGADSDATITNNIVTGVGVTTFIAQNGIQVSRGATAIVSDNTVSGNEYDCDCALPMDDYQSGGILLYLAGNGVDISNNTITDNDYGIYNNLSGGGATNISGNTIDGNRFVGIIFDEGNAVVRRNTVTNSGVLAAQNITAEDSFDAEENYWGSASGPETDSVDGNISYDPWYVDAAMTKLSNAPASTGGSGYVAPQPLPGSTPDAGTPSGEVLGDSDEQPETPPGQVLGDTDTSALDPDTYVRTLANDTVYYVDADLVRHPVIDAQTYFTYTDTWDDVVFISEEDFATLTLGKPVLPKVMVVLVKIQSSNEVYVLEFGADGSTVLRQIPNEMTARYVYGDDWEKYVIDVEPTHFKRFTMGSDIDAKYQPDMSLMKTRAELNNN